MFFEEIFLHINFLKTSQIKILLNALLILIWKTFNIYTIQDKKDSFRGYLINQFNDLSRTMWKTSFCVLHDSDAWWMGNGKWLNFLNSNKFFYWILKEKEKGYESFTTSFNYLPIIFDLSFKCFHKFKKDYSIIHW